ncbi:MAG: hypothetical protein U1D30_25340 [Planctomycetota bacterium]
MPLSRRDRRDAEVRPSCARHYSPATYEVALQQVYGSNFNTLEGDFNRYVASLETSVSPVQTAQQNPVMPNQQFFR